MNKFIEKMRTGSSPMEIYELILKSDRSSEEEILEFVGYLDLISSSDKKFKDFALGVGYCYLVYSGNIVLTEEFISAYKNRNIVGFFSRNPELRFVYDKVLAPYLKGAKILYEEAKKEWLEAYGDMEPIETLNEDSPVLWVLHRASESMKYLDERDYQKAYWTSTSIQHISMEEGLDHYIWSRYIILLNSIYIFLDSGSPPDLGTWLKKLVGE